jgi:hypothetical protein
MDDQFTKFALWSVGAVASGTVVGLIKVWLDLYNFKLSMAVRRPTHEEFIDLRDDVKDIKRMMSKVVGRLQIPAAHDE